MEINKDIVYHYCSAESFLNIIQSATLHLSDINKSNDYKEIKWIRDKINHEMQKSISGVDKKALNVWNDYSNLSFDDSRIAYTVCFSELRDSLSQWRGYASDGLGFAIGFSKSKLRSLIRPYNIFFEKVIYKEETQNKYIKGILGEIAENLENDYISHVAIDFNVNHLSDFLKYKNPCFEEEKEWRFYMLSNCCKSNTIRFNGVVFSGPKFRTTSDKIISYIEMDFSKIKSELIKEIWIGPKSKVSTKDVLNVLNIAGYYNVEEGYWEEEPIYITKSEASYV